jgi:hypothetical protein
VRLHGNSLIGPIKSVHADRSKATQAISRRTGAEISASRHWQALSCQSAVIPEKIADALGKTLRQCPSVIGRPRERAMDAIGPVCRRSGAMVIALPTATVSDR